MDRQADIEKRSRHTKTVYGEKKKRLTMAAKIVFVNIFYLREQRQCMQLTMLVNIFKLTQQRKYFLITLQTQNIGCKARA